DFRNTNEPIPGIDDQSLKNLKDIEPLQEPSDDSSAIEIQVASEETMDNANKIAEDLKAKGYNPLVEPFVENGVNRFRVKISESSEENANKKLEELKALEYKPLIIGK
ncbi:SPOR domain-containing protein, partial [bacterium]|nr:SPOR domain-containing protein [bacterium]